MKRKIAILFSMFALVAFVIASVSYAQSPKTTGNDVKIEKTVEKKAGTCCDDKSAKKEEAGCCTTKASAEKAEGCASAGKTCGGCSSKATTTSAEAIPVPKK